MYLGSPNMVNGILRSPKVYEALKRNLLPKNSLIINDANYYQCLYYGLEWKVLEKT